MQEGKKELRRRCGQPLVLAVPPHHLELGLELGGGSWANVDQVSPPGHHTVGLSERERREKMWGQGEREVGLRGGLALGK